mgnify:FL=1
MKKLLGIVALFLLAYIILKFGLQKIEVKENQDTEIATNFVSDKIDTKVFFYQGKLIDSNMLLVKESTNLNNAEFEEFKKSFDFDKNTYLIINCKDKEVSEVLTKEISSSEISFKVIASEKENYENSVVIMIENFKITNLNLIKVEWEES